MPPEATPRVKPNADYVELARVRVLTSPPTASTVEMQAALSARDERTEADRENRVRNKLHW